MDTQLIDRTQRQIRLDVRLQWRPRITVGRNARGTAVIHSPDIAIWAKRMRGAASWEPTADREPGLSFTDMDYSYLIRAAGYSFNIPPVVLRLVDGRAYQPPVNAAGRVENSMPEPGDIIYDPRNSRGHGFTVRDVAMLDRHWSVLTLGRRDA